ncbi:hypothetical protein Rhe02_60770 [Rhizocola hellebori]|uniref:Uncharacterized protein n=2 Tax=Rhizocola hellebori TaxID=1392758 RepID=A0A8J3QCA5_9ACTN|nr:hypothetical protein Rhe02_60770 [Rhizocola hellebori]
MYDERGKPAPGQEHRAFEPFLRRHSPAAYRYTRQAFDSATAHDICQEAWIELRHGWGTWHGKPIVWLDKLLLRHMIRWRLAQTKIADEPAFALQVCPAPSDRRRQPPATSPYDDLARAYRDRIQDPDLRRALDSSIADFRRSQRQRRSGRLAGTTERITGWLTGRAWDLQAPGLARWQIARMINLRTELITLAVDTLRSRRPGEEFRDLDSAHRIVAEVFALAEVHQQGRLRIAPTRFDTWLKTHIQARAATAQWSTVDR